MQYLAGDRYICADVNPEMFKASKLYKIFSWEHTSGHLDTTITQPKQGGLIHAQKGWKIPLTILGASPAFGESA